MPRARRSSDEPLRLARSDAYIGVMIDDLVNKGVDEPYRMLTSRAEHRVILRHDNADVRLTPIGRAAGSVDDAAWEAFEPRRDALRAGIERAERTRASAGTIGDERIDAGATLADALRRPTTSFDDVADRFDPPLEPSIGERVAIELKCAGYVRRQEMAIEKAAKTERIAIPDDFDYAAITALSREAREKLDRQRPRTLGSAGRIPGVTPADVAIVGLFVHRAKQSATA